MIRRFWARLPPRRRQLLLQGLNNGHQTSGTVSGVTEMKVFQLPTNLAKDAATNTVDLGGLGRGVMSLARRWNPHRKPSRWSVTRFLCAHVGLFFFHEQINVGLLPGAILAGLFPPLRPVPASTLRPHRRRLNQHRPSAARTRGIPRACLYYLVDTSC